MGSDPCLCLQGGWLPGFGPWASSAYPRTEDRSGTNQCSYTQVSQVAGSFEGPVLTGLPHRASGCLNQHLGSKGGQEFNLVMWAICFVVGKRRRPVTTRLE